MSDIHDEIEAMDDGTDPRGKALAHKYVESIRPFRDTDTSPGSATRGNQIERIAYLLLVDENVTTGAAFTLPSLRQQRQAERLYDAGLRSQPASEPSLDVSPGALTKAVMDVTDELHLGIYSTEGGASWFDRRRFALLLAARLAEKP